MNEKKSIWKGDVVTQPAKITHVDITLVRGAYLNLDVTFDFGGTGQGFPSYTKIDTDLIKQFMEACDEEKLSECEGNVVKVTGNSTKIKKITPMDFEEGEPFDLEKWEEKLKEKYRDERSEKENIGREHWGKDEKE